MSHEFQVSDEQYEKIAMYAAQQGQTPEALFQEWVDEIIRLLITSTFSVVEERVTEEELLEAHPVLRISGILAINEPGWADRHDEYLAEAYMDNHAEE